MLPVLSLLWPSSSMYCTWCSQWRALLFLLLFKGSPPSELFVIISSPFWWQILLQMEKPVCLGIGKINFQKADMRQHLHSSSDVVNFLFPLQKDLMDYNLVDCYFFVANQGRHWISFTISNKLRHSRREARKATASMENGVGYYFPKHIKETTV